MQGKKKICAIFTTVILFLSGFIYVTPERYIRLNKYQNNWQVHV